MRKLKLFLSMLMLIAFSVGNVWADVESGTTYTTDPKTPSVPANWTVNSYANDANYTKLASNTNYIQTDEFCQNGFTSIKIKARKFGGPSAAQAVISVEWFENGGSSTVLATVSPTGTSLVDYTLSDLESVTGNKSGYIKISCKAASGGKGCGVSQVTITYTAGSCGGGTPTCATPTFSPAAGSYEGTQNVTISSTTGATIYYTTDGTTPSTTSSVYSTPIAVAADMTIKAYAVKTDYNDSEVATAAYEITEGPDVTINLLDDGWGFPTSKVVDETSYTNGDYTIKVAGTTGQGFRTYGTYFLLGQNGAYIELPEFANPIEKIVVSGNSGGSGTVTWNIFKGDDAVSAAASGCKNDAYTFNIDPVEANAVYRLKVTSAANLQIKTIKIFFGSAPAVAKPTISGDENFVTSTTVTISHADADHIYYTTNGDAPTTSSAEYSAPFSLTETATVKAIAVKGSDVSAVAEKDFTKVTALSTMAEVQAEAAAEEKAINVAISNWVVTAVSGSQVWITDADNEKGILLYKSGHGFTAGKKLNGTVVGTKIKLYNLYPELTSLVASEVTVTDADAVSPRTTTIAALTSGHPAEQGTVVKLEGVTYTSSALFDGVNSIAADNKFFSSLALVDGTTYDITGVVTYYKNGDDAVVKIAPRSAADVEAQTPVVVPTAANLAALKAAERGTYILTLTNAVVTYVNGNNAFIEDATGGALIYFASHGYSAGDCLNGDYQVVTTDYQGKFEITAMEPQAGAATTTAEIPLTTVSIATLNADFAAYESKRIKIAGANVTDAISGSDRNGAINDGAALAVYAAVASTITLTADDNVDIIGYPGFHNTDQQLNVWRQEDITVNVKEDPELAYDPASVTIEEGDAWSAPTLVNPHSLTIASYASNNESVATVTGEGVIALAGGLGTAVITAHTDGDATYAAGNATYTITVNEAGVYSMSFDLSRASYDDAADEEVVWNSNVVTITAQKNTGTKVTNYLAGNYSSGTLIAETRLYENNILVFTPKAGVTITKVEWHATAKAYAESLAKEGTTTAWTNATAALDGTDDKLVIITPSAAGEFSAVLGKSGSNKGTRALSVVVFYTAESEKAKLTASISIDDMNMAVGDDDILLSAIAATSNPNKKAISYAVTSGTAVTIEGTGAEAALHAAAEGSATITATIPNDLGNYTGATTTFDIVVAAAPATLVSIAISGDASVLEYTAGQHFNPAGLVVTGTYSDASTAPITEGIDWAFDPDPLTEGTTSVSVTATVGEISSAAVVVNGLTVAAAPAPTSGNIVILAEYNSKFYAMTNSLTSGALAGVEVEKDGSKIVVSSAEDKAAIQWTATVDGDNTTLKDGDDYYIKGSSGASLSLEADPYNWNWDGEKSCYISSAYTNRGLFFSNSGNVFKGYALSNITSDGYAATEVIEIDPEDIVISSKVDPALAYTPASDEITVGDAWSAPVLGYVEGFDGLAAITYESSNEAVATVTDAGVIALAGGTGTATITATFGGNTNYLAGSATYTVKVNEPAEDCDGSDDFITATSTSASSYNVERTTTNGWSSVNSALTTINSEARWLTMLGKTSQVGVITSPTLSDGIASLKIRYANTFSESNGVSFRVDIKQGEDVVKTFTVTKANSEVTQGTVYTEIIEDINVAGEFQIIFTNLCPSAANSNKDRVSIGKLCWENYAAPAPVYETVREGLTAGNYYTICYPKAMTDVQGATLWSFVGKDANFAYIVQETASTIEAGKPYIMYATASTVTAVLGDETNAPGANGAIHGTFSNLTQDQLNTYATVAGNDLYLVIGNELRRATGYALDGITPLENNSLPAQRAFVVLGDIPAAPAHMPAHVRRMPMQTDQAQGFENIEASEKPMKLMIDGQMYILRGEKVYDATGRLVK